MSAGLVRERLWIEDGDGAAKAHRVLVSGDPHLVEIEGRRRRSVEVRTIGNGAVRVVPMSELTAAAPLMAEEVEEYDRLDGELAGTFGDGDKLRTFNALRLRALLFGEAGR